MKRLATCQGFIPTTLYQQNRAAKTSLWESCEGLTDLNLRGILQ
jgi:ribulose bisphosphate carboxylase small subunit